LKKLFKKSQIVNAKHWPSIHIFMRPAKMPTVPAGHQIVCGVDHGEGEMLSICENLADMQALYDEHVTGHTVGISWYHTADLNDVLADQPCAELQNKE
jgi:hypothetical protein